MAKDQYAKSGCGCSSKANAAPAAPARKGGCCGGAGGGHDHDHHHHAATATGVVDPVCGIGVETQSLHDEDERLWGDGATAINIAVDGKLAGLFAIADPVKLLRRMP